MLTKVQIEHMAFIIVRNLLKEEKILGIVAGRLWPLDRFGIIK